MAILLILLHTFALRLTLVPFLLWQAWRCAVGLKFSAGLALSLGVKLVKDGGRGVQVIPPHVPSAITAAGDMLCLIHTSTPSGAPLFTFRRIIVVFKTVDAVYHIATLVGRVPLQQPAADWFALTARPGQPPRFTDFWSLQRKICSSSATPSSRLARAPRADCSTHLACLPCCTKLASGSLGEDKFYSTYLTACLFSLGRTRCWNAIPRHSWILEVAAGWYSSTWTFVSCHMRTCMGVIRLSTAARLFKHSNSHGLPARERCYQGLDKAKGWKVDGLVA
ncbi:hypothetical protein BJY52DRAFT_1415069 [Lactarius psammicola]|nr:hypothetical protein BJY52DRAFT_1415069 [Lactarius psammicola]